MGVSLPSLSDHLKVGVQITDGVRPLSRWGDLPRLTLWIIAVYRDALNLPVFPRVVWVDYPVHSHGSRYFACNDQYDPGRGNVFWQRGSNVCTALLCTISYNACKVCRAYQVMSIKAQDSHDSTVLYLYCDEWRYIQ